MPWPTACPSTKGLPPAGGAMIFSTSSKAVPFLSNPSRGRREVRPSWQLACSRGDSGCVGGACESVRVSRCVPLTVVSKRARCPFVFVFSCLQKSRAALRFRVSSLLCHCYAISAAAREKIAQRFGVLADLLARHPFSAVP